MKNIIYTRYPIVVASAFGFLQCRRSKALFCIQAFHHRGSPRHVVARSVASSTTLQEAAGGNNSNDDDDDDDDSMMIVNTIKSNNNNNNNSQHNQKVDWDDRIGLQAKWTNEEKGWKVAVEWRQTPFGAGLFAAQDILAETALRVGKNGRNLLQFRSVDDIEAFCRGGDDDDNDGIKELSSSSSSLYRSRLLYAKDYLWGFNPNNADQQGYDNIIITDDESKLAEMEATRFFGMWVPGNGLNHNPDPNTVYRPDPQGGTDVGINLVALRDIRNGEELFDDYRRHGKAPKWLLEFAEEYKVTLNFAECNDFVVAKGKNDKKK